MPTLAIARTESEGCPPRQFVVTFLVGDTRQVVVQEVGGVARPMNFAGKHWRPGSRRIALQAIAKFREIEEQEQLRAAQPLERINHLLTAACRQPAAVRGVYQDSERQLPVGDRT